MKISKKKCVSFSYHKDHSTQPKIRFLAQKLWSVARVQRHRQTDTQTHRQTDRQTHTKVTTVGRGHPFRVSGVFPSTIIKDRPNIEKKRYRNSLYRSQKHETKHLNLLFYPMWSSRRFFGYHVSNVSASVHLSLRIHVLALYWRPGGAYQRPNKQVRENAG